MDPRPPLPERFKLQLGEVLELSWKWKRLQAMPLLLFLCCCPGPCGFYGEGLVSGTVRIKENGKFVGYAHVPWLGYILIASSLLMAAALLYVFLVNLVNRTTLHAGHERVSVRHGPLPLPGLELHANDIVRIEEQLSWSVQRARAPSQQRPESSRGPRDSPKDFTGKYAVYAIDRQEKRHLLVSDLDTKEQGGWLARELRRALGMRQPEEDGS